MHHTIVIVGGGAGGIAAAASLLKRNKSLDIAIIEPSDSHYYQPGWTMVGAQKQKVCLIERFYTAMYFGMLC
jgi:NADH dehydrogenase FAD-containing subunit